MTDLLTAHNEWATRPADQRFWSVPDLHNFCAKQRRITHETSYDLRRLSVRADRRDLMLVNAEGRSADFTNWSFGQFCRRVDAPASFISTLKPETAAIVLNERIAQAEAGKVQLLVHDHRNDGHGVSLRAATSEAYDRIFNADITSRLQHVAAQGWQVPPARPAMANQPGTRPATDSDVLACRNHGLSIKPGDLIAPAGLYASDRDMFAFMVDEQHRINDGSDGGLARGFFVRNSEVGDGSFALTTFLYRVVCGNHIVWGAEGIREVRIRHVGDANGRAWRNMECELRAYAESSAAGTEQAIAKAKALCLGSDKDAVLDRLFGIPEVRQHASRKVLAASWDTAIQYEKIDGAPDTAWGFAQGMTRFSQTLSYANARNAVDRAAGKVLALAN